MLETKRKECMRMIHSGLDSIFGSERSGDRITRKGDTKKVASDLPKNSKDGSGDKTRKPRNQN